MAPDGQPSHQMPAIAALRQRLSERLVGHDHLIERLLIAALTGGHVLLEGSPGLAKTRAVKMLATALSGSFARIQGTPDLLPADLTGTPVFQQDTGRFEFSRGPVFHNLVLLDEINRAPPKVQSALLEAMDERQVTSGGETHALPDPFLVIATQNPIDHEGTYPLPEAQIDRFQMHVILDMPDAETERAILDLVEGETAAPPELGAVVDAKSLAEARATVEKVFVALPLRDYIVRLVMATREGPEAALIAHPVSPRGSLALAAGARAMAFLDGRDHALPQDVEAVALDVLAHRTGLHWRAVADGETSRGVISRILADTPAL